MDKHTTVTLNRDLESIEVAKKYRQLKKFSQAEEILKRIIKENPLSNESWKLLGNIYRQQNKLDKAIACYEELQKIKPSDLIIEVNLGCLYLEQMETDKAITCLEKAIKLKSDYAPAYYNLGNVYKKLEDTDRSIHYYQQAIKLKPNYTKAYHNLGIVYQFLFDNDRAIDCYQKEIQIEPRRETSYYNLGLLYQAIGNLDRAIEQYHKALKIKSDYPEVYNNLGNFYRDKKNISLAIKHYNRAIEIKPDYALVYYNLGIVHNSQDNLERGIHCYQKALEINPNYPEVHNNLGQIRKIQGKISEAITHYKTAIELKPTLTTTYNNLLFTLHCPNKYTAKEIFSEHLQWGNKYTRDLSDKYTFNNRNYNLDRKLRIGYVSGDFRIHSVAYFFEPLITDRNREQFQIICYSNNKKHDSLTKRLKQKSDLWRDIYNLGDREVAELIYKDEIDILVDLSGHTDKNRLLVFAQKPAPIQVTYLGYPNTTGLKTINYRLTDNFADPIGTTEHLHTEKLIHLPHGFLCYHPYFSYPQIQSIPAIENNYITFGTFNNLAKLTPEIIQDWASILKRVPNSVLLLKSKALKDKSTREYIYKIFGDRGINKERLQLKGRIKNKIDRLTLYNKIDIALDTFPYHGTTTTCEALLMGVPVITKEGNTHVSRVGVSLLSSINLSELIASSSEEYIEKAVTLSQDIPRLKQLRHSLRKIMKQSPLMNGKLITSDLESAYKNMWSKWCQKMKH